MSRSERLRISVDLVSLIVQPSIDEIARFAPAQRGELVTSVTDAAKRTQGVERFEVVVDGWLFEVTTESARRAELRERAARQSTEHATTGRLTLRAQIPGRVVRLWVAPGEKVERGQRLLAVEAMKMENEIRAPQAGIVESVRVAIGQRVEREDELLTLG